MRTRSYTAKVAVEDQSLLEEENHHQEATLIQLKSGLEDEMLEQEEHLESGLEDEVLEEEELEENEDPVPLKRQDAFITITPSLLSATTLPPQRPHSPVNQFERQHILETLTQESLPFALSLERYGLTQLSIWMCRYCIGESLKRFALFHTTTEQTFLSLALCKECVQCNTEMQVSGTLVWQRYWKKKAESVAMLKEKHEEEGMKNKESETS